MPFNCCYGLMLEYLHYFQDAVFRDAVIVYGSTAESDRIYLVKSFIISPHNTAPSFIYHMTADII